MRQRAEELGGSFALESLSETIRLRIADHGPGGLTGDDAHLGSHSLTALGE